MAVPTNAEVKSYVATALTDMWRQIVLIYAAVQEAESAFAAQDFTDVTAALDEAYDQIMTARNAADN